MADDLGLIFPSPPALPLPQVLLLEGGARPELVTVTGKGPMDVAQAKGHKECVALLQVQTELTHSERDGGEQHRPRLIDLESGTPPPPPIVSPCASALTAPSLFPLVCVW